MSNDIYQLPQCTCSAFFPTSDALNAHLDEYRARESYLSAQLEICRSHSKANDDDDGPDVYEDDDNPAIRHDNGDKTHNCPLKECDRNIPFKTRQRLRRHFEQHVKCEEVCVCCHQISRRVSDFLRHAERHRDVGKAKTTYINQMCDELRERADNELGFAESRHVSGVERSKKRAREVGGTDSGTPGARKAKLQTVDMAIMNEADFQPANDTRAVLPSTQLATGLMSLSNVGKPVATGDSPNMSAEAFYLESIEGPTTSLNDINFDAPVNSIINFPELWIEWMQTENRTEYIESSIL